MPPAPLSLPPLPSSDLPPHADSFHAAPPRGSSRRRDLPCRHQPHLPAPIRLRRTTHSPIVAAPSAPSPPPTTPFHPPTATIPAIKAMGRGKSGVLEYAPKSGCFHTAAHPSLFGAHSPHRRRSLPSPSPTPPPTFTPPPPSSPQTPLHAPPSTLPRLHKHPHNPPHPLRRSSPTPPPPTASRRPPSPPIPTHPPPSLRPSLDSLKASLSRNLSFPQPTFILHGWQVLRCSLRVG